LYVAANFKRTAQQIQKKVVVTLLLLVQTAIVTNSTELPNVVLQNYLYCFIPLFPLVFDPEY
jgi:hypothetical protein